MMQIIHDIAPGADLAFYTAFDSEQDFANGILALAAAGCKVIVDDVSYFDEPFFQNGVVAQAIQTVEAEGVTYVTAAGNDARMRYQAAWTPIVRHLRRIRAHATRRASAAAWSRPLRSIPKDRLHVALIWSGTKPTAPPPRIWRFLFSNNGSLFGTATQIRTASRPIRGWIWTSHAGTYQIAHRESVRPQSRPDQGDHRRRRLPGTISGANVGTVYGHAMTPGAITAGAVSAADTPAFGVNPADSESFSSSGAGTELLFANNGTPLSSPDDLSPVAVSGVDDIDTTVSDLSDFYGTSAASASLAGVAALILSANPDLTPAQVEQIMEADGAPDGQFGRERSWLGPGRPGRSRCHGDRRP